MVSMQVDMVGIGRIFSDRQLCLKLRQWSKRFIYIAILLTVVGFLGTVQGYSSRDANGAYTEQLILVTTYEGSLTLGGAILYAGIIILVLSIVSYIVFFLKSRKRKAEN